jgi:hypothetical protein
MGRLCYPTRAPSRSWYPASAGPESCHGARRVWRTFCRPGTNFIEHYECRGTSLIGAGKLSRYRIFIAGTGAVSRYNLSWSQKSVTVQDLFCGQVRESGFKMLNGFIWPADSHDDKRSKEKRTFGPILNIHFLLGWRARHQAKSVTNNLPILSVLGEAVILK